MIKKEQKANKQQKGSDINEFQKFINKSFYICKLNNNVDVFDFMETEFLKYLDLNEPKVRKSLY